jgi:hypothetical protein
VRLEITNKLNLDVRNIFAGSHTAHCWRCSKMHQVWVQVQRSLLSAIHELGWGILIVMKLISVVVNYADTRKGR